MDYPAAESHCPPQHTVDDIGNLSRDSSLPIPAPEQSIARSAVLR